MLIANKIFHVAILLLIYFCDNLWHWKFFTADLTAVSLNNQHGIQRRRQDFGKKFLFEGYTAKRLIDEFLEKSWTKRGVNKLFKMLRHS